MKITMKTIALAVLIFEMGIGTLGMAETTAPVALSLPPQPLRDALNSLASQTGLQVVYPADEVTAGLSAPRLEGVFTATQALEALLRGSGLKYEFLNAQTVAVVAERNGLGEKPIALGASGVVVGRLAEGQSGGDAKGNAEQSADQSTNNEEALAGKGTSEAGKIEEIVVTAQKREERLQDVPISISVLSGDALDRSHGTGVIDALRSVPGTAIQYTVHGGGSLITVRGVGASGVNFNGSTPIAYYLDSVPFGFVKTAALPDANAFDLDRVEILRGPQGTLYGASAQNGVVRILTKDADLDDFELKARTAVSSTDASGDANYKGDLAINIPLIEGKLAARAVVGHEYLGGFIDGPVGEDLNDAELRNYRLKINSQVTDKLSIGLSAWRSDADFGAPTASGDDGTYTFTHPNEMATDFSTYGMKIEYELPAFAIQSSTSYLDYENVGDITSAPLYSEFRSRTFSEEVILNSKGEGSWRWSLGGMYRDSKDELFQDFTTLPILIAPIDYYDISKSYAVFGQVTRLLMEDRLELTGGLRYFNDDVTNGEYVAFNVPTGSRPLWYRNEQFSAVSPRAVVTWHASKDVLVYGSYSEGFRSGFPQNSTVGVQFPTFPALKADTLRNYELGAKAEVIERLLAIDAALYYIDWEDVQQTLGVPIAPGSSQVATGLVNGSSASGLGFDLGLTLHPGNGLDLGVNVSVNDLTQDAAVFNNSILFFDKGDRLSRSPKYVGNAWAQYAFALGQGGYQGRIAASASYTSEVDVRNLSGTTLQVLTGDNLLVGRASFTIDSPAGWSMALFGENLNNESGAVELATAGWPSPRLRARTIGVQFEIRM